MSCLEYTQETQREQMTLTQVEQRLSDRMRQRFNEVYDSAGKKNITMRESAMDIAVSRWMIFPPLLKLAAYSLIGLSTCGQDCMQR